MTKAPKITEEFFKGSKNAWGGLREINIRRHFQASKAAYALYKDPSNAMVAFRNLDDVFSGLNDVGMITYNPIDFDNFKEDDVNILAKAVKDFSDAFPYVHAIPEGSMKGYLNGMIEESMEIPIENIPSYVKVDWDGTIEYMKSHFKLLSIQGEKYWLQVEEF